MKVTEDSERMIGALLLGNNIVNILSASLATALLTRMFGDSGVALATLVMTALVLVFGEVMPKTLAITFPEAVATRVAPIIRVLILIFSPVVSVVRAAGARLSCGFAASAPIPMAKCLPCARKLPGPSRLVIPTARWRKRTATACLVRWTSAHRTVDEIMRHRRQIEMIDADLPPGEILTRVLASPHTRLPIFRDSDENILGVVHAKDLLREVDRLVRGERCAVGIEGLDIVKVAMKPYFIPDTTSLDEQMREFLTRRTHFALVVDEYGALQGLITLEDILEEIVGDITDEFDVVRKDCWPYAGRGWQLHRRWRDDDPRPEPSDRLAPSRRRGEHHRRAGDPRGADDPERRPGLQLSRVPLRSRGPAREPDHPAEAAAALTRPFGTDPPRAAPRLAQADTAAPKA